MNFETSVLGTVVIIPLIAGIVEAAKKFGVEKEGSFALAIALGTLLVGYSEAVAQSMIPPTVQTFVTIAIAGIGGGLATTGLYDLSKKLTGG